jgi:hypothetical protein
VADSPGQRGRRLVRPHRYGSGVINIRSELREVDGEPEVWTNLGDILEWLGTLPEHTNNRVAADVAQEIRDMLFCAVKSAEVVRKP